MGLVKQELDRLELPDREAHNSRMFIDLCENIHIHYREFRIVFSLDEYLEFADILARSTEDVRSYLAQNPDYREGVYPTTIMVAGGAKQQRKLLENSPQPNRSAYFANDFAIELQDESVIDEIHVHWRDYRFAMPRDQFKLVADSFSRAKTQLQAFEATHTYTRSPHRDRTMDDFASEAAKYGGHRPAIMGEKSFPVARVKTRFDADARSPGSPAPAWMPDESHIAHLTDCYRRRDRIPPIVLSTERDGTHHVIDGNHRLQAARTMGLAEINAIVTDMTFAESEEFRRAEACLKRFDRETGYRFNASGFNRQFFAYRASRYYADHFHGLLWGRRYLGKFKMIRSLVNLARRCRTAVGRAVRSVAGQP